MNLPIKELLLNRLEDKGIEGNIRIGFLRTLSRTITVIPDSPLSAVNRRLHYLGWKDVDLDYHTLQLAVAYFEVERGCRDESVPCTW
jgi:hypothetical protein